MLKNIIIVMALLIVFLVTLFIVLPTPKSLDKPNELYITQVRFIKNGKLSTPKMLHIKDGVIRSITETTSDIQKKNNAISAKGLIAIPGLIDAHTHSFDGALYDALRFGVSTQLDMFTDIPVLTKTKKQNNDNRADLLSAGMLATAPRGHGTQFGSSVVPITQVSEVENWVKQRKEEGSNYIKMVYIPNNEFFPSISLDIAKALIKEAHTHNLLALAHIDTEQAALDLIENGIDGLVHMYTDKKASNKVITLAKKHRVFMIPTLSVLGNPQLIRARIANLTAEHPALSLSQRQSIFVDLPHSIKAKQRYTIALKNTLAFHQAGVPILAGSDAPNPTTAHGISLHVELQHLVNAGLTPEEAINAASKQTALAFTLDKKGSLKVGHRADILLLKNNPLNNIQNTLDIAYILKNGNLVKNDALVNSAARISDPELSNFTKGLTINSLTWSATSDNIANGTSTAAIRIEDNNYLSVIGNINNGFNYPWAGTFVSAINPTDISEYKALELSIKGKPGRYRVMSFQKNQNSIPPMQEVTITKKWKKIRLPLRQFAGFDPANFTGFSIVAGEKIGEFDFQIKQVMLVQ